MQKIRRSFPGLLAIVLLLCVQSSIAQKGKLDIVYTVALTDVASREFHITTEIKNINQPRLDLALPTWTPGWYVVENYGKNVLRFTVKDANGKWIQPRMTRKSLLTSLGDRESHPAATLSPVAEGCVTLGPALPSALPPMTPHERDPLVERSEGIYTRAREDGDKSAYG
jgi:hypothetical protein